jgi:AraC-like DNA-binding protein
LSLNQIGSQLGISGHYLGKLFHDGTGQSFHQYLRRVRMEKAGEALRDPLLTVQQVAFFVGYNDPSNFCREFRRHYGKSPREFCIAIQLARLSAVATPGAGRNGFSDSKAIDVSQDPTFPIVCEEEVI